MITVMLLCAAAPSQARRRRHSHAAPPPPPRYTWEGGGINLSPVLVQPYHLPTDTDPAQALYLRKMNLEEGLFVHSTRSITKRDVDTPELFVLDITQSLEGGFDSVNLYDRGILSWGLMQWSARSGSLTQALVYVKRRLLATHRRKVWEKTFVANGLDVDANNLIVYGKPATTPEQIRVAFRGTAKVSQFDPALATHWATTMARAGRQPDIASLEVDYASNIVQSLMHRRLDGLPFRPKGRPGVTLADLAGDNPYDQALVFALWTNNPRHSLEYVADAARAAHSVSEYDDPSQWPPGTFSDALMRRCQTSRFGNWRQRANIIQARALFVRTAAPGDLSPFEAQYQVVLAARKAKHLQDIEIRDAALASKQAAADAKAAAEAAVAANQEKGLSDAAAIWETAKSRARDAMAGAIPADPDPAIVPLTSHSIH
ncbi:hypothetical protein CCAX7_63680 [Capsulimonas corticalis]|uniref:Uncharacterized protein n=2 Tax=Capsulimonas corticalis TaxID=2219043 RepID=A0A402CWY1_9BACT|nr:hypothetical protein CCAX7_63680 [Capsulimonas corticalis]